MKPKILLIIDDDPDDREFFCEALKEVDESAICYACKSGMDAIDMLTSAQLPVPDFIFLDLNMPVLSGKQCLQALKKIRKLEQTHIIIYTTSKLTDDFSETINMGAMHFMTKPTRLSELRDALANVLAENWTLVR
ncbi:response regulator [Chitinophaga japonensis]|uniref:Response regulator receiver domain-containing protein n=1 Tax=Chitinophaga japonensis TaxID=104662 RepID=A0A562T6X3_CHIJA|nr:response regulator [Chitinophaga japonensis]TWI89299.1 response regulator receiver domain-containing protein [Chitinophaga japonensis]